MGIRPHIKASIAGKAVPICVLSEGSHVDRAMFNCIAHILYDRPCETSEEIDTVWNQQMASEKAIMKLLKSIKHDVQEYDKELYVLVARSDIDYLIENLASDNPNTVEAVKVLRRRVPSISK